MPYSRERRKDPEIRKKLNAWARGWYVRAKARNSERWKRRKEKARLRAKKYQQRRSQYQKRMWREDPQRMLAYGRKHKLKVLEVRAGRKKPSQCEVCGGSTKIAFDHCHQSGVFRGWICFHCNAILGHARDDPSHLRKLAAYLARHTYGPGGSWSSSNATSEAM